MKSSNIFLLGVAFGSVSASATTALGMKAGFEYQRDKHLEDDRQWMDEEIVSIGQMEEERNDRYTPCTEVQVEEINEVQDWVLDNLDKIMIQFARNCGTHESYNCDLTTDEIVEIYGQLIHEFYRTQFFCPTINGDEDDDTAGSTVRYASDDRPGQMAIYPLAFDIGKCEIAMTFAHELGHIATGTRHEYGDLERNDWIYLLGNTTKGKWQLDRDGNCN